MNTSSRCLYSRTPLLSHPPPTHPSLTVSLADLGSVKAMLERAPYEKLYRNLRRVRPLFRWDMDKYDHDHDFDLIPQRHGTAVPLHSTTPPLHLSTAPPPHRPITPTTLGTRETICCRCSCTKCGTACKSGRMRNGKAHSDQAMSAPFHSITSLGTIGYGTRRWAARTTADTPRLPRPRTVRPTRRPQRI